MGSDRPKWGVVGKFGIVDSCEFWGDASIAWHSHPLFSMKSIFFFIRNVMFTILWLLFIGKQKGSSSCGFKQSGKLTLL